MGSSIKQITEEQIRKIAEQHVKQRHPDTDGNKPLQILMREKLIFAYCESAKWMQEQIQPQIFELERLTQSDDKHIKSLENQLKHYEVIADMFIETSPLNIQKRALLDRIEKLEQMQPKWISVKDKLPENGSWIFAYDNIRGRHVAWYDITIGWEDRSSEPLTDVTHWMLLPGKPTT